MMKILYGARYILESSEWPEDPRSIARRHRWAEDAWLAVENEEIRGIFDHNTIKTERFSDFQRHHLGQVALVPGLVNAHSHAFQRAIRGRTEYLAAGREDEDFWSWRHEMYRAALGFDADEVEAIARLAFKEMALSGVTSVGEFHYLHHQPDGKPYADPNELAHRVIRAARAVGLRISLLRVGYQRAGFGREAAPDQRRFIEPEVDIFTRRLDALREAWSGESAVSFGVAPHSIRAVPAEWLRALADYARADDLPFHIHACEQRRELEESREEYGTTPVAALQKLGALSADTTLVHATHLAEEELEMMGDLRPTVCACPSTERNLGDGFLPALDLARRNIPVSLGSDSHTNIDLWEEMRLVEYHERLRYERRNVLATALIQPDAARPLRTADILWPTGSVHGARALKLPVGELRAGRLADFVALDLEHITLARSDAESLLPNIILSMTPGAVRDVFVGGRQIVSGA